MSTQAPQVVATGELRDGLFRVGDWLVDPATNRIERDEEVRPLRHKAMALLLVLAEQPGRVVSREELVERIWDGNEPVALKGIANTIWTLRQTLGDTAEEPRYIETIAKRGYRLLVGVERFPAAYGVLVASSAAEENLETSVSGPSANSDAESRLEPVESVAPTPVTQSASAASSAASLASRQWARKLLHRGLVLGAVVLLSVAGTLALLARKPAAPSQESPQASTDSLAIPLMTTRDAEALAVVSPDHRFWAFARYRYGRDSEQIFYQPLDGDAAPRLVATVNDGVAALAWSPDGTHLAIQRHEGGDCHIELYAISGAGGAQPVARCDGSKAWGLAWSSDGQMLAFSQLLAGGGQAVVLVSPSGGAVRQLTQPAAGEMDHVLAFSPDGQRLLVRRNRHWQEDELLVLNLKGEARSVWRDAWRQFKVGADWWQGEEVLLSMAQEGFTQQLMHLNLSSGKLTPLGENGISPNMLPDGRILFVRASYQWAVSELDLRRADLNWRRIANPPGLNRHVQAHESGRVLFSSTAPGLSEAYEALPDGAFRRLTQLNRRVVWPALSPDQRWLAFSGQCSAEERIALCIQDMSDDTVTVLAEQVVNPRRLHWQDDSQHLIFVTEAEGLLRVQRWSLSERRMEILADVPANAVRVSSDGRRLYWSQLGQNGVRERDLASGQEQLRAPGLEARRSTWDVAGDTLVYVQNDGSGALDVFRQRQGQATESLGRLPAEVSMAPWGSLSPDGQRFLFAEMSHYSIDPAILRPRQF